MLTDKEKRVQEVAEGLLGTTKNLEDVITEGEAEDSEFLTKLDEEVMECATCGWWCETSEMDDDENCEDCQ